MSLMSAERPVTWHQPVMGLEVLQALDPQPGETIVDATAGTGGHSLLLVPRVLPTGRVIALDRDEDALRVARQRLTEFEPQVTFAHGNFRELSSILANLGVPRVDGVLLDLGMSSAQLDDPTRGFSFTHEGPLDMRMDAAQVATADALVNELSADELAMIFETFGEERFARRIARHLVQARRARRVTTTTELSHLVIEALPPAARHGRLHAATRVFQALRMAVNDELGALQAVLEQLPSVLNPGGRAAILTFHSLEDRLVKHAFAQGKREGTWTVLTNKPLPASDAETAQNPRARSAKLRAIKIHHR